MFGRELIRAIIVGVISMRLSRLSKNAANRSLTFRTRLLSSVQLPTNSRKCDAHHVMRTARKAKTVRRLQADSSPTKIAKPCAMENGLFGEVWAFRISHATFNPKTPDVCAFSVTWRIKGYVRNLSASISSSVMRRKQRPFIWRVLCSYF